MGACWRKIKSTVAHADIDDLLSYNTVKVLVIRDRRLGALYYLCILAIVGYILGFTILYQKRYVLAEVPTGSVRTFVSQPPGGPDHQLSELPYCKQSSQPYKYNKFNCTVWDGYSLVWPGLEQTALLVATAVVITNQTLVCDDLDCSYVNESTNTFYISDVEDYTLTIDHTFLATLLRRQENAINLHGKLLDSDGNEVHISSKDGEVGSTGRFDSLRLGKLLSVAGLDSLDSKFEKGMSRREVGVVVLMSISYTNLDSFDQDSYSYTIQLSHIEDSEFQATEVIYNNYPNTRILIERAGIRILFLQGGSIGQFDFPTLLISIVSGFALVSLSTLIVDMLLIFVMPDKQLYRKYKYQKTVDFSDVHSGIIEVNANENEEIIVVGEGKTMKRAERILGTPHLGSDTLKVASEATPLI